VALGIGVRFRFPRDLVWRSFAQQIFECCCLGFDDVVGLVFPAKLNIALYPELAPHIPRLLLWLRLLLQVVLICWAWNDTNSRP
jgi:uncharacterized membrane protein